jgi:hypothetical protein
MTQKTSVFNLVIGEHVFLSRGGARALSVGKTLIQWKNFCAFFFFFFFFFFFSFAFVLLER